LKQNRTDQTYLLLNSKLENLTFMELA